MFNKKILIVFLVITIGLVVAFFSLGLKNDAGQVRKKRVSPFYRGLPVKTIRNNSVLLSANSQIKLPPVLQGDLVEHDILIENRSNAPIQLEKIKSCCGFLLNHYSRQIPKNGQGKISLLVITDTFGGQTIKGKITGETNDKKIAELNIGISLQVEQFAEITQHTIELTGTKKDDLIGKTKIIPIAKYPFKITGLKPQKGYFFDYSYIQVSNEKQKEYVITVKNKIKKPVIYRDMLFIQTDHPIRPELKIRVKGKITE